MKAQCHCGNIQITIQQLAQTYTICNCSICRRLNARWSYYKSKEVRISHSKSQTKTYQWGDQDILFHHCPICACITHYSCTEKSGLDRIAVNLNMLEAEQIKHCKIRYFNGADM